MAENDTTGEDISPSHRPKPRPRMPSVDKPPLPAKRSVNPARDLETRLGIYRSSAPVIPSLPSPPDQTQRRLAPEPPRRSDEHTEGVSADLAKDSDAVQSDESAEEPEPHMNSEAETVADGHNVTSVATTAPLTTSTDESGLTDQPERLQMRSKVHQLPAAAETSGMEDCRVSQFSTAARVSLFVAAAEKAAKPEKPAAITKPGRLVVPNALEKQIANGLARQQTMRTVQQNDDLPDVGVNVPRSETVRLLTTSLDKKPSRSHHHDPGLDIPEDTKSMLLGETFCC